MSHGIPNRKELVMRKRVFALAASILAAGGIMLTTAAVPVAASPEAPAARVVHVDRTASAATLPAGQPCNQLLNPDPHLAFVCITADAFNKYGADYWLSTAYTRLQTIHPATGLLVVTDAYYCRPNKVIIDGHVQSVDAGATTTESYCERGAPDVPAGEAEWQARVLSVYDGHGACVVYHWKVVDTQTNPPAPTTCFDEYTGKLRPMTALEIKSVLYGWYAMYLEPGAW